MDKTKKKTKDEIEEPEEGVVEEIIADQVDEVEEFKAKYARALADYQNLEKRVREERSGLIKNAGKTILLNLLPVFDTLTLALKHSQDQNLLVSVAQFLDALKAEGVTRIETIGKNFDPAVMDCIQTVEGEDNKVINEVRAGFMLHDKLLRAAEVTVGKK